MIILPSGFGMGKEEFLVGSTGEMGGGKGGNGNGSRRRLSKDAAVSATGNDANAAAEEKEADNTDRTTTRQDAVENHISRPLNKSRIRESSFFSNRYYGMYLSQKIPSFYQKRDCCWDRAAYPNLCLLYTSPSPRD